MDGGELFVFSSVTIILIFFFVELSSMDHTLPEKTIRLLLLSLHVWRKIMNILNNFDIYIKKLVCLSEVIYYVVGLNFRFIVFVLK